jgi:hypothetical protein
MPLFMAKLIEYIKHQQVSTSSTSRRVGWIHFSFRDRMPQPVTTSAAPIWCHWSARNRPVVNRRAHHHPQARAAAGMPAAGAAGAAAVKQEPGASSGRGAAAAAAAGGGRTCSGIVYCLSRKEAEGLAAALMEQGGIKAAHYHAGMTPKQRTEVRVWVWFAGWEGWPGRAARHGTALLTHACVAATAPLVLCPAVLSAGPERVLLRRSPGHRGHHCVRCV